MDLTPAGIHELLTAHYPRHVDDAQIAQLSSSQVPGDRVLLIVDETMWDFDTDLGRSAHSMTLAMARHLHRQLSEVIDQLDQIID